MITHFRGKSGHGENHDVAKEQSTIQNSGDASLIKTGGNEKKYMIPSKKTLTLKLKFGRLQKIFRLAGGNPLKLLNNAQDKNVCFSNVVIQCLFSLWHTAA